MFQEQLPITFSIDTFTDKETIDYEANWRLDGDDIDGDIFGCVTMLQSFASNET
jgi:hypothetical protein